MSGIFVKRTEEEATTSKSGKTLYYPINPISVNGKTINYLAIKKDNANFKELLDDNKRVLWLSDWEEYNDKSCIITKDDSQLISVELTKIEFKIDSFEFHSDQVIQIVPKDYQISPKQGIKPSIGNIKLFCEKRINKDFNNLKKVIEEKNDEINFVVDSFEDIRFEFLSEQNFDLHIYYPTIEWDSSESGESEQIHSSRDDSPSTTWKEIVFTTDNGSRSQQITQEDVSVFIYSLVVKNPFEWEYKDESGEVKKQNIDVVNLLVGEIEKDEWKELLEVNKEVTIDIDTNSPIFFDDKWALDVRDFKNATIKNKVVISSNSNNTPKPSEQDNQKPNTPSQSPSKPNQKNNDSPSKDKENPKGENENNNGQPENDKNITGWKTPILVAGFLLAVGLVILIIVKKSKKSNL